MSLAIMAKEPLKMAEDPDVAKGPLKLQKLAMTWQKR